MRERKIFPCRDIAQIASHIGRDAQQVVHRRTFEAQRRRGLVTVQDNIAVIVVEVEVDIPDGRLVRRAGYGHHPVGPYRQLDRHRMAARLRPGIRSILAAAV